MDWLSGWLKSVVLVILLATFVDLLLPNRSMQRYVKTVMSLFLLLTLLQPVLGLFEKYGGVEELLGNALFQSSGGGTALGPLSAVQQQAESLKKMQETQARHLAETQAAEMMKIRIEQYAGVRVQGIRVTTGTDGSGQPVLTGVTVAVHPEPAVTSAKPGSPEKGAKPVSAVAEIKPVQPVLIQIGGAEGEAKPAQGKTSSLPPALIAKKAQIEKLLEQEWQLAPEQIALTMLEPAAGS
ncbi:stage III sporulation protein AF [Paenibacillus filicis]|uniref:Stage III sporulation protein AF n=1 Tax=Paenibacillus gyeongsangnamensis TaxID=3388067 RepID=A0ABT4Q7L6_9BACL|nr:stage III sporulation protein AF [Paenibacillus filicis]MCZ8512819.1 stage III sporulation protein AF [Paenibacillus filicis]